MTPGRRRQRAVALASLVGGLSALGCEPSSGPRTGGLTNWLEACASDSECGELSCLCGACTLPCAVDETCAELPGASCVAATDVGVIALCSGCAAPVTGLCLARCEPAGCPAGTACVAGICSPLPEASVRVSVDVAARHQTLVGFGASLSYTNDEVAQHPQREALFDAMFRDSGLELLRLRNRHGQEGEEDLTSARTLLDAARERLERAPTLILTSWSPPGRLKANGSNECQDDADVCTLAATAAGDFDYAGFADHWRDSLLAYAAAGIVPDYIGLQNNPNWSPPAEEIREACRFLPTEGTATVTVGEASVEARFPGFDRALAEVVARLGELDSPPRIVAPEVSDVTAVADYAPHLDFSQIDAIGHHLYGFDPNAVDRDALANLAEIATQADRPLLQTEMQAEAPETAILIHHALVDAKAAAYLQNDFISSAGASPTNTMALIALTEDGFVPQTTYHVLRHYAFATDPGWVRVDAVADASELLVSAWLSPTADALTVVLVNTGVAEQVAQLELEADLGPNSTTTRTVFDGVERSASLGELPPEGILRLPGRSIVTVATRR